MYATSSRKMDINTQQREAPRKAPGFRGTLLRSPAQAGRPSAALGPRAGARSSPHLQGRPAAGSTGAVRGVRAAEVANEVVEFLAEIDLLQYADCMLENGYEDLDTLLEMEDEDMADLGMPRGHVLKLRRRLRELGGAGAPQTLAAPAVPAAAPERPLASRAAVPAIGRSDHSNPTGTQVSAVQNSWEVVKSFGTDRVGGLLYRNLFELDSKAIDLFPREVRAKYQSWTVDEAAGEGDIKNSPALAILFGKVVSAVGFSVSGMHETEKLVPKLRLLGMRHVNYKGVSPVHYPVLQTALINTLRQLLGEEFTPEVEFAWSMVYGFISAVMCEGLREALEIKARSKDGAARLANRMESGKSAASSMTASTAFIADDGTEIFFRSSTSES